SGSRTVRARSLPPSCCSPARSSWGPPARPRGRPVCRRLARACRARTRRLGSTWRTRTAASTGSPPRSTRIFAPPRALPTRRAPPTPRGPSSPAGGEASPRAPAPRPRPPPAEPAGAAGGERFVLDAGGFPPRRDDTAGLGDWYVDPDVWPDGLTPLIDRVRGL